MKQIILNLSMKIFVGVITNELTKSESKCNDMLNKIVESLKI
jgi:hypothetical protein